MIFDFLEYIKSHSITHVCNAGVTCSGNACSQSGLLEFPSVVFLEATIKAKEMLKNEPVTFPPD